MFVLGISAYYLLKGRDIAFAKRSFAIASSFGLASILSVIILGDESGYEVGDVQKAKLAAIEAEWETHPAPAAFTLVGFPNEETQETDYAIRIPWVLGLIATRSFDEQVTGIKDLKLQHRERIINGMDAYALLQQLRAGDTSEATIAAFEEVKQDLGYGLLLKRYTDQVVDATEAHINAAVDDSIPSVAPLFWSFRLMVGLGMAMLVVFILAFIQSTRHRSDANPWVLRLALFSIPMPWLAAEAGWFVAEHGRQPWSIAEVLPTYLSASSVSESQVMSSLTAIIIFYTALLIVEMYLMFRFARLGPSSLGVGRYHFETGEAAHSITTHNIKGE